MSKTDTWPCPACDGTGEQYREDLGPCYLVRHGGDPWVDCPECHGYGFEQSEHSRRHAIAILAEYRDPREYTHGKAGGAPWPAFYRADVEVHDMNELAERDPDLPFGWITRETGSMLVRPEDPPPSGFSSSYMRGLSREGGHRFYWWDGRILVSVDGDDFADRLDAERARLERIALRNFRRAG